MIKNFLQKPTVVLISRIVVGGIFIYASHDKILQPLAFAQVNHYYRLLHPDFINIWAIILPWMELFAGVFLIVGYRVRGSALLINGLLVMFAVVLAITAARGINVACGCFTTSTAVKSNLIIRMIEDIGILLLGLHVLFFHKSRKERSAVPEA